MVMVPSPFSARCGVVAPAAGEPQVAQDVDPDRPLVDRGGQAVAVEGVSEERGIGAMVVAGQGVARSGYRVTHG